MMSLTHMLSFTFPFQALQSADRAFPGLVAFLSSKTCSLWLLFKIRWNDQPFENLHAKTCGVCVLLDRGYLGDVTACKANKKHMSAPSHTLESLRKRSTPHRVKYHIYTPRSSSLKQKVNARDCHSKLTSSSLNLTRVLMLFSQSWKSSFYI